MRTLFSISKKVQGRPPPANSCTPAFSQAQRLKRICPTLCVKFKNALPNCSHKHIDIDKVLKQQVILTGKTDLKRLIKIKENVPHTTYKISYNRSWKHLKDNK